MAVNGRLPRSTSLHRTLGAALLLAFGLVALSAAESFAAFSFDTVKAKARAQLDVPFKQDDSPLPAFFRDIDYVGYREIKPNYENMLWRKEGSPIVLAFAHRGFYFPKKVAINVVEKGKARELDYSPDFFNFRKSQPPKNVKLPKDMGYAGLVLFHAAEPGAEYKEVMVFLGASYCRIKQGDKEYGLSQRGLAIDTVLDGPEEFPLFKEFWVEKPGVDAKSITIYALMDSPSVTGAYRMVFTPGEVPTVDVSCQIFARKDVRKLGVAPFSSMYWYGENTGRFPRDPRYVDDFRPEVHDSDGLMLHNGAGEWLYRPLQNAKGILVNTFSDENPRGFGLVQRDIDVKSYMDIEAVYHLRPGAWVEPRGKWGKGHVELVQISTDAERYDNVVAFWTPQKPLRRGDSPSFDYRVTYFHGTLPGTPPAGHVINTLQMRGGICGSDPCKDAVPGTRLFIVDFAGGILGDLPALAPVEPVLSVSGGKVTTLKIVPNPSMKGWRTFWEIVPPEGKPPVEMRVYLRRGADVLTETWTHTWLPEQDQW